MARLDEGETWHPFERRALPREVMARLRLNGGGAPDEPCGPHDCALLFEFEFPEDWLGVARAGRAERDARPAPEGWDALENCR